MPKENLLNYANFMYIPLGYLSFNAVPQTLLKHSSFSVHRHRNHHWSTAYITTAKVPKIRDPRDRTKIQKKKKPKIIYVLIWLQLLLGFTVALHSTEALMAAGFLKSQDLGGPPHGYGAPHPHHSVPHGPLPPGMGMPGLGPFLPHTIDVGFPQGMWGKYRTNFGKNTNNYI
uniref:Uncharacterized protein n=1 Tax=Glossina pallidipes TaxID=7398 RepID=A0A1A9ZQD2_GLOPL